MPVKKSRLSLRKSSKRIYKQEYQKAKADALRKARSRSRKQLKAAARKKAESKYNRTARERSASNKKKMKVIASRLKSMSENMVDGFENNTSKANKKSSSKKKQKSVWDMTIDDMM